MKFGGPKRKTYYDMDPWYFKNQEKGIEDWHQQVLPLNDAFQTALSEIFSNHKPKKILEIGCGGGALAFSYAQKDLLIDAFDFSEIAIGMAKNKPNSDAINFYCGDALFLNSYPNRPYDLIIAKDILHCIIGKDRLRFLSHVAASLSSCGNFILSTHIGLPETYKEIMKTIDRETRINCIQTRVYLDRPVVEDEFDRCGLKIAKFLPLEKYYMGLYTLTMHVSRDTDNL